MGYLADEPLGDALDEQGLDSPGRSLREQQRKAQAIDRDLPDNTGIEYTHGDLEADAADYSKAWKEMAKQAYGGTVTGRMPREAHKMYEEWKKRSKYDSI